MYKEPKVKMFPPKLKVKCTMDGAISSVTDY